MYTEYFDELSMQQRRALSSLFGPSP